jgi:xylan 1,4-beta-xylosidase
MIPVFGDENNTSGLLIKNKYFKEQKFYSENLLVHVLQGEAKVSLVDEKINVSMNEMLIIRGNENVRIESQKEETYLLIYTISNYLLSQYVDMVENTIETTIINSAFTNFKVVERTSKAIFQGLRQNKGEMDFHIRGLSSELLELITKNFLMKRQVKRNSDSRILEALLYIETNYRKVISLEEIANYFDVSAAYFSRYFKTKTGSGFLEYLTDYRLEKAAREITRSSEKISLIANQTGFTNINSFNKKFRMKFGYTPRMYRSKYTNKDSSSTLDSSLFEIDSLSESVLQESNRIKFDISSQMPSVSNNYPWKK